MIRTVPLYQMSVAIFQESFKADYVLFPMRVDFYDTNSTYVKEHRIVQKFGYPFDNPLNLS